MINSLQEQCFVHIMIEFCTMSSVPYFTHTHFGLQVVSLHDNQQHERSEYIAGSNFRTGGALFVHSMSLVHTYFRRYIACWLPEALVAVCINRSTLHAHSLV